jgi:hypothetical protein
VEFRKKSISSKREESFVEGQTLHPLERYLAVEGVLRLPSLEWDRPREAPYPVSEVAEAENAARGAPALGPRFRSIGFRPGSHLSLQTMFERSRFLSIGTRGATAQGG